MLKVANDKTVGIKTEALNGRIKTLLGKGGAALTSAQVEYLQQAKNELGKSRIDGKRLHEIEVDVKKISKQMKKELPPSKAQKKAVKAPPFEIFSKMETTQNAQ